jgi:hypothetical protein
MSVDGALLLLLLPQLLHDLLNSGVIPEHIALLLVHEHLGELLHLIQQ